MTEHSSASPPNGRPPKASAPLTYPFGWPNLRLRAGVLAGEGRLAIADAASGRGPRSARVSALLATAFELNDGGALEPERLSIVDRAAALFNLAASVGTWPARFACRCTTCGAVSELRVHPAEFTYREARAYVVPVGAARYMLPNGHHEAASERGEMIQLGDLAVGPAPETDEEQAAVQTEVFGALERAAPDLRTALPYNCSGCGTAAEFWFDPIDWIIRHGMVLLRDVHAIASAYGWSERAILSLPASRRRAYLSLIEGRT